MPEAFVFIGNYRVKDGKLEDFRKIAAELVETVETNEPRMIAFHIFIDEDASRTSVLQVHPDAASMEFHMQAISDHIAGAFNYLETESSQVFGHTPDALLGTIRQYTEPGVEIRVMPTHEAGFTRSNAE